MDFPKGDSTLVLNYETEIAIENKNELRAEVDEIWSVFKLDVEAANLRSGAIRAVHNETSGIISRGNGYGFAFEQGADGNWHCLDDDKK